MLHTVGSTDFRPHGQDAHNSTHPIVSILVRPQVSFSETDNPMWSEFRDAEPVYQPTQRLPVKFAIPAVWG
jgi:hypothetical protein